MQNECAENVAQKQQELADLKQKHRAEGKLPQKNKTLPKYKVRTLAVFVLGVCAGLCGPFVPRRVEQLSVWTLSLIYTDKV
jgi:hypothetical protein